MMQDEGAKLLFELVLLMENAFRSFPAFLARGVMWVRFGGFVRSDAALLTVRNASAATFRKSARLGHV